MRAILTTILVLTSTMASNAQVVEGVGFYLEVVDRIEGGVRRVEPRRGILSNSTIRLGQLPLRVDSDTGTKRRTVYVAATLGSEAISSQVVFVFRRAVRLGDDRCGAESDQDIISDRAAEKLNKSGVLRDVVAAGRLLANSAVSTLEGVEVGPSSLKYKVVTTHPNIRTYYDYRFVHCPGLVQAWVTDNRGNVLGPSDRNPGIILPIAD